MMRPQDVPPPKLNGGLYTGEPFKGPWGNVHVTPDVDYMTHVNLKTANPPIEALMHYPGGPRPGNNSQKMPGVALKPIATAGIACQTTPCPAPLSASPWAKFAAW